MRTNALGKVVRGHVGHEMPHRDHMSRKTCGDTHKYWKSCRPSRLNIEDIKIDFTGSQPIIRNDDSEWASRGKNPVKFWGKTDT